MATASTMLPLGTPAPAFALPDVRSNTTVTLESLAAQPALLVMFICAHCPYVKHVEGELARIGHDYAQQGLAIVAIGANDATAYPDDAPEQLAAQAERVGFTFPYLYDETQEVARDYAAACTPDFFLFDGDRALVYRGQLDGSRPRNDTPVSGVDLRRAIEAVLRGQPVATEQTPSMGCSIKWRD